MRKISRRATERDSKQPVCRRFAPSELARLKRTKGVRLISMDAVLAAPHDNAWNTVRLHFEDFNWEDNPEEDPSTPFEFRMGAEEL